MRTDATKTGQCILDLQGKLYDLQQKNERLRETLRGIAAFARERDFSLQMDTVAEAAEQALEGGDGQNE